MAKAIEKDPFLQDREAMVREQIAGRGVQAANVLEAMRRVPRHLFLPKELWAKAYEDHPLPIGPAQTISQPYIVAAMAETLQLTGGERVLEIGSGCGYAASVISLLAAEVFGIELQADLAFQSMETMKALGFKNVFLRQGDGNLGWPDKAPFDAILLSCAATKLPKALWDQLAEGGRLLAPLGPIGECQHLILATKRNGQPQLQTLEAVVFVPLLNAK